MRISTKGRYSLEALLYMVLLPAGEYSSAGAIAEVTGISEGYLEQLFIPLRKAGIIRGIRGPQGGYLPGRNPDEITVGDILRTVEGALESSDGSKMEISSNRNIWAELYREINNCMDSITLADLVQVYETMEEPEYLQ